MLQNLHFTGVGAGFNPSKNNTSAYFVQNEFLVLIDCGETVFTQLYRSGILQQYTMVYLLVTHTHADHVASLPALVSFCHMVLGYKVRVVHPHPEKIHQLCQLMGVEQHGYTMHSALPKGLGFQCEFVPVRHALNMNCYGLLLSNPSGSIYYSGDAAEIPEQILQPFLHGDILTMYQDTSLQKNPHHASLDYLCKTIPPKHRNMVYCMHLNQGVEKTISAHGFRVAKEDA